MKTKEQFKSKLEGILEAPSLWGEFELTRDEIVLMISLLDHPSPYQPGQKSVEEYMNEAQDEAAKAEGFENFAELEKAFSKSTTKYGDLDLLWNRANGRVLRILAEAQAQAHAEELTAVKAKFEEAGKLLEDLYNKRPDDHGFMLRMKIKAFIAANR